MKTWLATKGIVIGLCCGLPVFVALMIFGVDVFTLLALAVCGGLIAAGIFSFSGKDAPRVVQVKRGTTRDGPF